ncbi:DNA replication/repair protein RecF [Hornefia butyriciproducens]|uniref:DNA replication/repair protein RecF n=1 Tax=Hornefia butyriciproducens TaxID=2652293 RepID=UPI003F89AA58
MYITELELKNFRNYKELTIQFDKNVNIIVGRNAQGKTNLIEAVFLSSIGRSFRTSHDSDLIRFGQEEAFVRVKAEKEVIDTKVEIKINRHHKKSIQKDGNTVHRTSQLIDNIIIVIFSPDDLKIVKEEPEKRRKFIDRELAQIKPAYYDCLSNYKKTLQQRNACLKEDYVEPSLLSLWDEQMIIYGSDIIRMRKDFIDRINEYSSRIHQGITNRSEDLSLQYDPNIRFCETKEEQQEVYRKELMKSAASDLRMRTTTRGPQKDDLQFFVNGVNARSFGSQGQQRTCALSLKLAELDFIREETGEKGILLLDDVMSELDESRRDYLVKTLHENQLFITTTDIDPGILEYYPQARIIEIEKGECVNLEKPANL